ncbi:hypothetical protein CORC01_09132 [Colletotrichum orchidophilum]|uniref:Uncharacterized protein n=1 Tax=Colletotrichum orchidophilum TaxID=1209926 RepID=A0A1G4B2L2_9PEZI|nr:uncharacterized protein CORC01_09132 [Colletotrichum orchidophilum]OHE95542.1 hypothetical protein CORC01_09132 [Colletotrichum orchidophilum]
MCLAENVYYVDCGCWQGHHICWECPKRVPGAGAVHCPDLSCSGVYRQPGKCLVCRRREIQQRTVFPLSSPPLSSSSPLPPRPSKLGKDEDDDDDEGQGRVSFLLLAEILRRAVDDNRADGSSSRFRSDTASLFFLGDGGDDDDDGPVLTDTADGELTLMKASEQTFETTSTAWHHQ